MAKSEIERKRKSNEPHQVAVASWQAVEHDWTININGVAMQCTIHKELASIPILSGFNVASFILNFIIATKLQ